APHDLAAGIPGACDPNAAGHPVDSLAGRPRTRFVFMLIENCATFFRRTSAMPRPWMTAVFAATLTVVPTIASRAESLDLSVEIPRLNVSEYHRPYVAIWIRDEKHKVVANLAVW